MSRKYRRKSEWEELLPKLVEELESGTSVRTLAYHYDCDYSHMLRKLKELGVTPPKRSPEQIRADYENVAQNVPQDAYVDIDEALDDLHDTLDHSISASPSGLDHLPGGNYRGFSPTRFS